MTYTMTKKTPFRFPTERYLKIIKRGYVDCKLDKKYLIVGIGINLKKNPNIKNYPTDNLFNLINKNISKRKLENELKIMFEAKLTKLYKLNF